MANLEKRRLERLRHLPGEDLRARDFRDQEAIEAQLRWWHNRALHGAYGVRSGLQAVPDPMPADLPLAVVVQAGLAYDAFGRELVLPRETRIAVPADGPQAAAGGPRILYLRHVESADAAGGAPPEPCRGPAAASAGERPELCGDPAAGGTAELAWQPADRFWRPADGVPLCRLTADQGALAWDFSFSPPLVAPLAQPRFATGSTLLGGTAWTAAAPVVFGHRDPRPEFQVWVDTRAAGFTAPPCYFAWVQGRLNGERLPPIPVVDHVGRTFLSGFYFHVRPLLIPTTALEGAMVQQQSLLPLARRNLAVGWLGVQIPAAARRPVPAEVTHGKL
jgi:hypothetical protein